MTLAAMPKNEWCFRTRRRETLSPARRSGRQCCSGALTADAKKRVVLPGGVTGDVFVYEETANGVLLKRIYRHREPRKQTKEQAAKAIKGWKSLRGVKWEELRKLTRDV